MLKIYQTAAGILLVSMGILLLGGCANPVTPEGGPKDVTPPKMLKAEPPMFQTNFEANKIRIYFNEFVELKDLQNQLVISPPMKQEPEFKIRSKSVVIELKEELKDSTTYNIFFGNAIVDITENNPLTNFQYVFSTWDIVDSLSLRGDVTDAFTLEPVGGVNVMLYLDNNDTIPFDSMPYFVRPYFMSKTNDSGNFRLNNLPDRDFLIFALEDGNSNLIFDQPSERIAFSDSLVHPYYIEPPVDTILTADSLLIDSLKIDKKNQSVNDSLINKTIDAASISFRNDSLLRDSLLSTVNYPYLVMKLFQETDSTQRFIKAALIKKNQVDFIFKRPTVNPEIRFLNVKPEEYVFLEEWNKEKDTLTHWITHAEKDSLVFAVKDDFMDFDTVAIAIKKMLTRREEKEAEEKTVPLKYTIVNPTPELNQALKIKFAYPIVKFDTSGFLMVEGEDTLTEHVHFTDTIRRKAEIRHQWLEKTSYHFIIPDSTFQDILGLSNDTITNHFTSKSLEDYGRLFLDFNAQNPGPDYIFRLQKENKIIREIITGQAGRINFEYLLPGKYRLKLIIDKNHNQKWDAGNYIHSIQPEEVRFYRKVITVRANWDIEDEWDLDNDEP